MIADELLTLSAHDKKVISDIVESYAKGDRVKVMRHIFKGETTLEHFIYLGHVLAIEKIKELEKENIGKVFRMETLRLLN